LLKWQLFDGPIHILAFIIGLNWGVTGVAYAFSICQIVIRIPAIHFATKNSPIKLKEIFDVIWKQGVSAVLAAFFVVLTTPLSKNLISSDVNIIMYNFVSYLIFYLIILYALPGGQSFMVSVLNIVNEFARVNLIVNITRKKGITLE
jgi:hypothetical protein